MVLSCLPGASWCLAGCPIDLFLPPWCLADCPIDPFLPPWCLASCPNGSFLPPWCLSGCPNGPFLPPCQREPCAPSGISVLGSRAWSPPQDLPRTGPFAIEVVLKLDKIGRPDSIGNPVLQVSLVLPPWCLPGCPNGSFLPPWCLPGASQTVQLILSCTRLSPVRGINLATLAGLGPLNLCLGPFERQLKGLGPLNFCPGRVAQDWV